MNACVLNGSLWYFSPIDAKIDVESIRETRNAIRMSAKLSCICQSLCIRLYFFFHLLFRMSLFVTINSNKLERILLWTVWQTNASIKWLPCCCCCFASELREEEKNKIHDVMIHTQIRFVSEQNAFSVRRPSTVSSVSYEDSEPELYSNSMDWLICLFRSPVSHHFHFHWLQSSNGNRYGHLRHICMYSYQHLKHADENERAHAGWRESKQHATVTMTANIFVVPNKILSHSSNAHVTHTHYTKN